MATTMHPYDRTAFETLQSTPEYKALNSEREAQDIYEDAVRERVQREKEERNAKRRSMAVQFGDLLRTFPITVTTNWQDVCSPAQLGSSHLLCRL